MPSGISSFPQELVDYTIDYLHDNKTALLRCACVCKSWLPGSSVHLFSDFTVPVTCLTTCVAASPFENGVDMNTAAQFIMDTPRIARNIRSLHLHRHRRAPGSQIAVETTYIQTLASKLPQLRSLALIDLFLCEDTGTFPTQNVGRRPRLRQLSLRGVQSVRPAHLTPYLDLFEEIGELRLEDYWICQGVPTAGEEYAVGCADVRVRSLTFGTCAAADMRSVCAMLCRHLSQWQYIESSLFSGTYFEAMPEINRFLETAPYLQGCVIHIPDREASWDVAERSVDMLNQVLHLPNLALCSRLQNVEVIIPTKMSPVAWESVNKTVWNHVMDMLALVPEPCSIRLTIGDPKSYVHAHFCYVMRAMVMLDWSRLGVIVERKPSLTCLDIRVGCKQPGLADLHAAIREKLSPRVRRILRIRA